MDYFSCKLCLNNENKETKKENGPCIYKKLLMLLQRKVIIIYDT